MFPRLAYAKARRADAHLAGKPDVAPKALPPAAAAHVFERRGLGARLWTLMSPGEAAAHRPTPEYGRDQYWRQRLSALPLETRIPMRGPDAAHMPPGSVPRRRYVEAEGVLARYTALEPAIAEVRADASTRELAACVTGALAALRGARSGLVQSALAHNGYTSGIDLALCVVLAAARRLPAFYAAQVAIDVRAALTALAVQDEAQTRAAWAFARSLEAAAEDIATLSLSGTRRDVVITQQVDTGTRSAVAALVYAHTEDALTRAALHSGLDVADARARRVAQARVQALWSEPWAALPPAVFLGDALSKVLSGAQP